MHPLAVPAPAVEDLLDQLQSLGTDHERQRFFASHSDLATRSLVETLTARATSLLRVDHREAENLISTAFWLADVLNDDFARGKANRAYANLIHLRGDQSQALHHYALAKSCFLRVGADLEAAITASSSLQALVFQGKHDSALHETEFARSVFEQRGDRLRLARLNFNYATLLYHRDQWAEAARYNEAAYTDFLEVGSKQDVAVCLHNMAVCHQNQHDFSQALAFYKKTRSYCEENGLNALTADLDYNIAYLHYLRGQYTTALGLYREARARHTELGNKHHIDVCALSEAEIYLELNLTGECADLAKVAYSGFRDRGLILESAKALTLLAAAESRQGQSFLALELLLQAQELFEQIQNELWAASTELNRATLFTRTGRLYEARRLARSAEVVFHTYSVTAREAACRVLLAKLSLEERDWEAARASCSSALALLLDADAPALSFHAHYVNGEVERIAGNPELALKSYLSAHDDLERLTGSIQTEDQRISIIDDRLTLYESLVGVLASGDTSEENCAQVFAFVEKAKSRSLTDLLAFRDHALPATQPGRSKLADQVRQLREELNWYYRQIDLQEMRAVDRASGDVEALRRYSRQQENRLIHTLGLLQRTDKEFSSVQEAFSVDLATLRSTLPTDTTVLEYFVASGTVIALVVNHSRIQLVPVTLASTVKDLWRAMTAALSSEPAAQYRNDDHRPPSFRHLEALYAELVEPIEDLLGGSRLIVVPHGPLFYLPFHAFRTRDNFLSDLYALSYAPSATAYHLSTLRQPIAEDAQDAIVLLPLEGEEEASRLASRIEKAVPRVKLVYPTQGGHDRLRDSRVTSRWIHLITKAQLRDDNPMFSTVYLGGGPAHFFDLFQLRLDTDLVVVSGCAPSLHADAKGNEIVGLVRGLLYSGARSVLTTLWEVSEEAWGDFAEEFYPLVVSGQSIESSLHAAIAALRQANPDPRHWAAFALFGDSQGVGTRKAHAPDEH